LAVARLKAMQQVFAVYTPIAVTPLPNFILA